MANILENMQPDVRAFWLNSIIFQYRWKRKNNHYNLLLSIIV